MVLTCLRELGHHATPTAPEKPEMKGPRLKPHYYRSASRGLKAPAPSASDLSFSRIPDELPPIGQDFEGCLGLVAALSQQAFDAAFEGCLCLPGGEEFVLRHERDACSAIALQPFL
jgi:hypothetical protein